LKQLGIDPIYDDILADIRARDERDAGRSVAPLRAAADAAQVDTTELDISATMGCLRDLLKKRLNP